jgi:starch synthase
VKPAQQIILSHSGKQHSYHVAKALKDLGYLKKFHTSSYVKHKWVQNFITRTNNQFWSKRFTDDLYGKSVSANWRFEVNEMIQRKLKKGALDIEKMVYQRDEKFDQYLSKKILKEVHPIFWGFQGSSLNSLKATKKKDGLAICELATAHVTYAQKILQEEMLLVPEWADTISNVVFPTAYQKRLEEEPQVADVVIAASQFTKLSLMDAGIDEKKIQLLPLGASIEHIRYHPESIITTNRPLKLLFAGTMTQRKGISYLLDAMKHFDKSEVELHCIGHQFGTNPGYQQYKDQYVYHGPMSQHQLFNNYCEYDALILPTIFEGFALVIVEAMAAGLPVITTANSIGPELITDGENGYLVPIRDTKALVSKIETLCQLNSDERKKMSLLAREAALNYSWKNYALRLSDFLTNFDYPINRK